MYQAFFDNFSEPSLNARWSTAQSGNSTAEVIDGIARVTVRNPTGGGAMFYLNQQLNPHENWMVWWMSRTNGVDARRCMHIISEPTSPSVTTASILGTKEAIRVAYNNNAKIDVNFFNTAGTRRGWNQSALAWQNNSQSFVSYNSGDWHLFCLQNDGIEKKWRFHCFNDSPCTVSNHGLRHYGTTDWVYWLSDMQTTRTGDLWLTFGHPITNSTATGLWDYDFVRFLTGDLQILMNNSIDQAGASRYKLVEHHSYGKIEDGLVFAPFDRSDFSVSTGLPGTWISNSVKDQSMCSGSDGKFYLVSRGQDGSSVEKIGIWSKTALSGLWTAYTGNPIVSSGTFPYLVEDLGSTDQRWKMLFGEANGAGAYEIHLVTTTGVSPIQNTWTYRGVVVSTGINYSWDHQHVNNATLIKTGNLWQLWYSASSTGVYNNLWGYGRATGTDLLALQKDPANPYYGKNPFPILNITGVSTLTNAWIVPCQSGNLFETGSIVAIMHDANSANFIRSKVKSTTATQVELYHQVNAITGGYITQINGGSQVLNTIIPISSGFLLYTTSFGNFRDFPPGGNGGGENSTVQFTTDLTGSRNYNWNLGLVSFCRDLDDASMENPSLMRGPIASSVNVGEFIGFSNMFISHIFHSPFFGR